MVFGALFASNSKDQTQELKNQPCLEWYIQKYCFLNAVFIKQVDTVFKSDVLVSPDTVSDVVI